MECARAISGPMLWDVFGPFFQQKRARHFSSKNGHAIFLAKTGTPVLQLLPFYPVSGSGPRTRPAPEGGPAGLIRPAALVH